MGEDNGTKTRSGTERLFEYDYAIGTDIGMRRTENQDAYGYTRSPVSDLFVLADGMGGNRGGATASSIAVNLINRASFGEDELVTEEALRSAILQTNHCILQAGKREEELSGMGTTIAILVLHDDEAFVAHIGDSRIYMLRSEQLYQITRDHTLVQELVDSGALSPEQAANHPIGHMLTRAVGQTEKVEVDVGVISGGVIDSDRFLLCSDGLYNHVENHEIHAALQGMEPGDAVEYLLNLANERGGSDNITIMIVSVRGVDPHNQLQEREGFYLNLCTKVGLRYCSGLAEASGFIDPDRIDYRSDLPEKRDIQPLQSKSRLIEPGGAERPLVSSVFAANLEDAEKYTQAVVAEHDSDEISLAGEEIEVSDLVETISLEDEIEPVVVDERHPEEAFAKIEDAQVPPEGLKLEVEHVAEVGVTESDALIDVAGVDSAAEFTAASTAECNAEIDELILEDDTFDEEPSRANEVLEDEDIGVQQVEPAALSAGATVSLPVVAVVGATGSESDDDYSAADVALAATPSLPVAETFRAQAMPEESLLALFAKAPNNSDSAVNKLPSQDEGPLNVQGSAALFTPSEENPVVLSTPRSGGIDDGSKSEETGEYVEVSDAAQNLLGTETLTGKVDVSLVSDKVEEQHFPLVKSRSRSSLMKLSADNSEVQQVTKVIAPVSARKSSVVTAVQTNDDTVAFRKRSFYLGLSVMAALLSLAGYVLSRPNSRLELAMLGVNAAKNVIHSGGSTSSKLTVPRHEMKPVERPGDRIVPASNPDRPLFQEDEAEKGNDKGVQVNVSEKGGDIEVAPLINAPVDEVGADVFREPEYLGQTLVERLKARYGYGERQWMELISYNPGQDALDKLSPADVQSKLMLEDRLAGVSQAVIIGRISDSSEVAELRMEVRDLIAAQNVALEESVQKLRKAKETVRRYKGDLGAIAQSRLLALAEELAVDHEDVDAELDYYRETQVLLAKAIDRYTEQPSDLQLSKDYSRLLSRTRERQDSLQALVENVVRRSYQQAVLEVASWGLLRWDSERRIARYRQELESLERWAPTDGSARSARLRKLESELNDLTAQLYQASVTVPDYLEVAFRREIIVKDEGVEP